jgi:hypothetical protein
MGFWWGVINSSSALLYAYEFMAWQEEETNDAEFIYSEWNFSALRQRMITGFSWNRLRQQGRQHSIIYKISVLFAPSRA